MINKRICKFVTLFRKKNTKQVKMLIFSLTDYAVTLDLLETAQNPGQNYTSPEHHDEYVIFTKNISLLVLNGILYIFFQ